MIAIAVAMMVALIKSGLCGSIQLANEGVFDQEIGLVVAEEEQNNRKKIKE